MAKRTSKEKEQQIVELLNNKVPLYKIAIQMNVSRKVVERVRDLYAPKQRAKFTRGGYPTELLAEWDRVVGEAVRYFSVMNKRRMSR